MSSNPSVLGLVPVLAVMDKGIDMMFHPDKPVASIPDEQKAAANEAVNLAKEAINIVLEEAKHIGMPGGPGGGRGQGGRGYP